MTRTIVRPLRRTAQLWRTRGAARTGYTLAFRVLKHQPFAAAGHLCLVDLWQQQLQSATPPARLPRNFSVRWAAAEDLPALGAYYDSPERVQERHDRGDRCLISLCQDRICAAVWLALGPVRFEEDANELGCVVDVPPYVAWSYDGKGTRLGAWGTLMKQLPDFARRIDMRTIVTVIDGNNWLSLDGHKSLGYQHVGSVVCGRCLGFTWRRARIASSFWSALPITIADVHLVPACRSASQRTDDLPTDDIPTDDRRSGIREERKGKT